MSRVLGVLGVLALVLVAIFVFVSFRIPTPRITQIQPADGSTAMHPSTPITITFSTAMDKIQTQSNVRIEPRVSGVFAWSDDQTLSWTPRVRLPLSATVTVRVAADALSTLQRPLGTESESRFTTVGPNTLTGSVPAPDARFVYLPDRVTMTFNRPLDGGLLADSMSINPPLENQQRAVNGNTVTVRGFFQPRTRYQITIPSAVVDSAYGIELDRDYVWSFTTALQYPHFSILNRDRTLKLDAAAPVSIPTQYTNVSRLDLALYPITAREFETESTAPYESWASFRPNSAPRITKTILTNARLDEYSQMSVDLGNLPQGAYYLQITTPEGVGDTQLVLLK